MLGVYKVSVGGVTPTAQPVTLAFVNPGASRSLEFLRAWAGQSVNATSAQQRVQLNTQVSVFPTLTSATPTPLTLSDAASVITGGTAGAAGTAGTNASAEGAGTKTSLYDDTFNVLNGWLWVPTPVDTHILNASAASGYGLHFPVTPSPAGAWSWGLTYRQLG
jgi:hypothetical protein